ncbi:hypothetical protein FACS189445_5380 [Spirochaetia bacterium]|nr:hypothetical protein FACS189445_5380 [Spirochaetia bacterium]
MNRRRAIILMFLVLGQTLRAQSVSLDSLVSQESAAVLRRGENITRFQTKNLSAALVPQDRYIQDLTNRIIGKLNPSFFVEILSVYRKPSTGAWTAGERAGIFNQTLTLSSLAELQYYSINRGRMHTFFETSTVVSGPDGKTPRPDPGYTEPPDELTIYARQKDMTFGDNVYRYDYYALPTSLIFVQENLTDMKYGIITAIKKNKLCSVIAIYDAGEYLLMYVVSMAKISSIPGMNNRIGGSFTNRAEAILNWFSGRVDRVF